MSEKFLTQIVNLVDAFQEALLRERRLSIFEIREKGITLCDSEFKKLKAALRREGFKNVRGNELVINGVKVRRTI